jgi:hypothetical protein
VKKSGDQSKSAPEWIRSARKIGRIIARDGSEANWIEAAPVRITATSFQGWRVHVSRDRPAVAVGFGESVTALRGRGGCVGGVWGWGMGKTRRRVEGEQVETQRVAIIVGWRSSYARRSSLGRSYNLDATELGPTKFSNFLPSAATRLILLPLLGYELPRDTPSSLEGSRHFRSHPSQLPYCWLLLLWASCATGRVGAGWAGTEEPGWLKAVPSRAAKFHATKRL